MLNSAAPTWKEVSQMRPSSSRHAPPTPLPPQWPGARFICQRVCYHSNVSLRGWCCLCFQSYLRKYTSKYGWKSGAKLWKATESTSAFSHSSLWFTHITAHHNTHACGCIVNVSVPGHLYSFLACAMSPLLSLVRWPMAGRTPFSSLDGRMVSRNIPLQGGKGHI